MQSFISIQAFSLKMLSAKWQPFCINLNVLKSLLMKDKILCILLCQYRDCWWPGSMWNIKSISWLVILEFRLNLHNIFQCLFSTNILLLKWRFLHPVCFSTSKTSTGAVDILSKNINRCGSVFFDNFFSFSTIHCKLSLPLSVAGEMFGEHGWSWKLHR